MRCARWGVSIFLGGFFFILYTKGTLSLRGLLYFKGDHFFFFVFGNEHIFLSGCNHTIHLFRTVSKFGYI